ncbi:hypothetical protein B5X24_HaOG211438 [Helicoverpa armigera]|nr:hypothetical protein B5X24_HaOG211438 [Helicoverpa armigera]
MRYYKIQKKWLAALRAANAVGVVAPSPELGSPVTLMVDPTAVPLGLAVALLGKATRSRRSGGNSRRGASSGGRASNPPAKRRPTEKKKKKHRAGKSRFHRSRAVKA